MGTSALIRIGVSRIATHLPSLPHELAKGDTWEGGRLKNIQGVVLSPSSSAVFKSDARECR